MTMPFFFQQLLGIFLPIDPRRWPTGIQRMRTCEGWGPPMFLIATTGTLIFVGRGIGLLGGNGAVKLFNYLALATWLVAGTLGCLAVTLDGMNNLRRLGPWAVSRPRWWFELSRLTWMLFLFVALSAILLLAVGGPQLCGKFNSIWSVLPALLLLFMVTDTAGYSVSAVTRHRRRGRAFECVQYFYMFGLASAVIMPALWIPLWAGWAQPLTILWCLIAASLTAALTLTILDRRKVT